MAKHHKSWRMSKAEQRMAKTIRERIEIIHQINPNRLTFERVPEQWHHWTLFDSVTNEELTGELAEIYAEVRTIGESVAFEHLAKLSAK